MNFWGNMLVCFNPQLQASSDRKEIQPQNLVVNLSGVEIKNLKLKKSALVSLELPIEVKEGIIEKVSLKLPPLTELAKKPAYIIVDRLFLLACPQYRESDTQEEMEQRKQYSKLKLLEISEMLSKKAIYEDPTKTVKQTELGWLDSKLVAVAENLRVIVNEIHFRYEDCISSITPFSLGVMVQQIHFQSVNSKWEEAIFENVQEISFKTLKVKNLAVYMKSEKPIEWKNIQELISTLSSMLYRGNDDTGVQIGSPFLSPIISPVNSPVTSPRNSASKPSQTKEIVNGPNEIPKKLQMPQEQTKGSPSPNRTKNIENVEQKAPSTPISTPSNQPMTQPKISTPNQTQNQTPNRTSQKERRPEVPTPDDLQKKNNPSIPPVQNAPTPPPFKAQSLTKLQTVQNPTSKEIEQKIQSQKPPVTPTTTQQKVSSNPIRQQTPSIVPPSPIQTPNESQQTPAVIKETPKKNPIYKSTLTDSPNDSPKKSRKLKVPMQGNANVIGDYLLAPLSGTFKVRLDQRACLDLQSPKHSLEMLVSTVQLRILSNQFLHTKNFLQWSTDYKNKLEYVSLYKLRPTTPKDYSGWWKYSFKCVLLKVQQKKLQWHSQYYIDKDIYSNLYGKSVLSDGVSLN